MPVSADSKTNTKLVKIKMAGYFKIINRNSLLLQARTKTRKVGGLLKIITEEKTSVMETKLPDK